MKTYIITGGCGFIGRNVISLLLERGCPPNAIKVVDNLTTSTVEDLRKVVPVHDLSTGPLPAESVGLVVADIRDEAAMGAALTGADAVIHLAAITGVVPAMKDPKLDCEVNVRGTLNLLEACRHNGIRRFVFASSGAPLGVVEPPIHEKLPARPMSPYGASKLAGEGYCSAYKQAFGIDTVVLRFGNAYGPYSGHKISIVAAHITRALAGKPLEVHGTGNATRDYIYTGDIADAILKACDVDGVGGEIFQISPGHEVSVNELTDLMLEMFARHGLGGIKVERTAARPVDIARSYAITDKARDLLGWTAAHTLPEGLEKTFLAFKQGKC